MRQVGYLPELYKDAWSEKYIKKKKVGYGCHMPVYFIVLDVVSFIISSGVASI